MTMPEAAALNPQKANSRHGDASHSVGPPWCRDYRGNGYTYPEALDFIRSLHGHVAPGLVIGLKMVDWAREQLPEGILFDAVQMLAPCTLGNSWLKIKDLGRFALIRNAPSDGDAAQKDGLQACVSVGRKIRNGAGENRGRPRDGGRGQRSSVHRLEKRSLKRRNEFVPASKSN